jgi:hypothetical protein
MYVRIMTTPAPHLASLADFPNRDYSMMTVGWEGVNSPGLVR